MNVRMTIGKSRVNALVAFVMDVGMALALRLFRSW